VHGASIGGGGDAARGLRAWGGGGGGGGGGDGGAARAGRGARAKPRPSHSRALAGGRADDASKAASPAGCAAALCVCGRAEVAAVPTKLGCVLSLRRVRVLSHRRVRCGRGGERTQSAAAGGSSAGDGDGEGAKAAAASRAATKQAKKLRAVLAEQQQMLGKLAKLPPSVIGTPSLTRTAPNNAAAFAMPRPPGALCDESAAGLR
jgi:hypothetical protein